MQTDETEYHGHIFEDLANELGYRVEGEAQLRVRL